MSHVSIVPKHKLSLASASNMLLSPFLKIKDVTYSYPDALSEASSIHFIFAAEK